MADIPRHDAKVKIVSNGIGPGGTDVFIDGQQITNCVSVSWKVGFDGVATATIELEGVELHVVPDPAFFPDG